MYVNDSRLLALHPLIELRRTSHYLVVLFGVYVHIHLVLLRNLKCVHTKYMIT